LSWSWLSLNEKLRRNMGDHRWIENFTFLENLSRLKRNVIMMIWMKMLKFKEHIEKQRLILILMKMIILQLLQSTIYEQNKVSWNINSFFSQNLGIQSFTPQLTLRDNYFKKSIPQNTNFQNKSQKALARTIKCTWKKIWLKKNTIQFMGISERLHGFLI